MEWGNHNNTEASFGEGQSVKYRCDSGFTLDGNSLRTCLSSGTWSGTEPSCKGMKVTHKNSFIHFVVTLKVTLYCCIILKFYSISTLGTDHLIFGGGGGWDFKKK